MNDLSANNLIFENVGTYKGAVIKIGANVIPLMSYNSYNLDTKFGKADKFIDEIGD